MDSRELHEHLLDGRLETILATIPVGVYLLEADGAFKAVNARADEIWGGSFPLCESVDGYDLFHGWWPETGERLRSEDWAGARALQGETIEAELVDIERFDGKRASIIQSASPLVDSEGNITGAVVAIQDATEQRERARIAALLLEALGTLAGSLESSEVILRLVRILHDMVGHTRASALLWHETQRELEIAAVMGEPPGHVGQRFPLKMYSKEMRRAVSTRSRVIADFSRLPEEDLGMAGALGIASSLIEPLVRGNRLLGLVTVDEMRPGVGFTECEVELAAGIASSAALAIENARLYGAERHVATTLQRALLAVPDELEGLAFAHAYRSASQEAFVGGDFYDIFETRQNLVGILIGDIAGKGLEAAVLTQLVKNTVRAHAADKGSSPAAIMSLTNNIFYQMTSSDSFSTAFFGVLDRTTGRLVYTNAGHTTCLHRTSAGGLEELPSNSPLLGAFAARVYAESEIRLEPGDSLVLYTDGVTEARHGGKQYGEERLFACVEEDGNLDPPVLVRSIIDDVLAFTGGTLNDDLAIMVVQRLKEGAVRSTNVQMEVAVT